MEKTSVVEYFGGINQTAKALDVTRSAVNQWKEIVPERIAHRAAMISRGQLAFDPGLYPSKSKNVGGFREMGTHDG